MTDVEARKRGEQTGLDTLVVHAVQTMTARCRCKPFGAAATVCTSSPPGGVRSQE